MNLQSLTMKMLLNRVPNKYKKEAQEAINLVSNNSPEQVISKLQNEGMDNSFVDEMYNKFAKSSTAKDICNMLGFSPDELKEQANSMIKSKSKLNKKPKPNTITKFPRLS